MKNRFVKTLVSLLAVTSLQSTANTNDIINQQIRHRDSIQKKYDGRFDSLKVESYKKALNYSSLASNIRKEQISKFPSSFGHGFVRKSPQAIVFVSFSMPKKTFEMTLKEANHYNIPVVLRGLYKNSFKKTAAKIFNIVKKNNQGGVLIDPIWFRKFHIKTVPALLIQKNDGSGLYDVVYGNVPIKRGLEIIAANGDVATVAKNMLEDN